VRALQVHELEGPRALRLVDDAAEPDRGDGVLIDVHTAGVAFPDVLLSRGLYQLKPDPPFTPGSEVAGTVVDGGDAFGPGERVMVFTFGGFAERASAPAAMTFRLPREWSFEEGAAFVMNYHTAHFSLHRRGRMRSGDTVVVHGAGGGVGSAALQVARGGGARTIAVVSSEAKEEVARRAGTDEVVRLDGWLDAVRGVTDGRGADIVLDPVGGERFADSVRALAPEGRVLVVGFAEGEIPTLKVNRLLLRNADVVGVAWGAFVADKPELTAETQGDLERLAAEGFVRPILDATYPLAEGAEAVARLEERGALGKVVLRVRE
jgi:NADPH:quinone reductase